VYAGRREYVGVDEVMSVAEMEIMEPILLVDNCVEVEIGL
jgi:hypothetical protein